MDFTKEGENIIRFKNLNKDVKYIDCPHVYTDLTTKHILVMQRMKGIQIDQTEKLKELGYDMNEIGLKLSKNYCKQVVDDAFFHADPHPGNIWINNGKIVWLDFGMMGTISKRDKEYFGKAMLAAAQGDVYTLKDIILSLGVVKGDINHSRLYADVDTLLMKYGDMDLGNVNLGILLEELLETAKKHSISMPGGITMLARGNITIEGVLSDCAPEVNIMQITADHVASKMYEDFDIKKQFFSAVRGTQSVVNSSFKIPAQLSDLLKMSLKGHSKLNLELVGSEEPISKIDSMVNRIIVCIIAAGLLVSSGNFLSIESGNEAFGFPVIGIIVFFVAIILAGGLLVYMMYKGRKKKK
jgi:ubiquinone biosynthesis protein